MEQQEFIPDGVLFHIPHSRTLIPDYYGMDMRLIDNEIRLLTDHHTEDIFYVPGIEQLVFPFSRIFCDVERLPDAEEPMFEKGKGFFYTHTDDGIFVVNFLFLTDIFTGRMVMNLLSEYIHH